VASSSKVVFSGLSPMKVPSAIFPSLLFSRSCAAPFLREPPVIRARPQERRKSKLDGAVQRQTVPVW
jgi:hypothetical protein